MVRRTKAAWEEILAEYKGSGKSVREFCKDKGLHANTFYLNRKKHRDTGFVEVQVQEHAFPIKPIILRFNDISIELQPGFCKNTLREILAVLR